MNENLPISSLPKEITTIICTFLEIDCIYSLICTSKALSESCSEPSLWILLLERDFLLQEAGKEYAKFRYKEISGSFKRKKLIFHDMTCPAKGLTNKHLYPPYGYTFSRNDPDHYVGRVFRGEVPVDHPNDNFVKKINEHHWYYEWEYYGNFSGIEVGGISKQKGHTLEEIQSIFASGSILVPEEVECDENEKQFLVYPSEKEYNVPSYLFKGTLLHWACMSGNLNTVQYLVSLGARTDLFLVNDYGEWNIKPIDIAQANGHFHVVKYLRSLL